jgi:hypothetical protein
MGNEKNRADNKLEKMMKDNPDWDWDYWKAQVA